MLALSSGNASLGWLEEVLKQARSRVGMLMPSFGNASLGWLEEVLKSVGSRVGALSLSFGSTSLDRDGRAFEGGRVLAHRPWSGGSR